MKKDYIITALTLFGKLLIGAFLCIFTTLAVTIMTNPNTTGVLEILALSFIQITNGILYFSFMYTPLRALGDRDSNRVAINEIKYDKYKGLKIGFLISIVYFILTTVLIFSKSINYSSIFGFINIQFYPIISFIMPKTFDKEGLVSINDSLIRKLVCFPLGLSYPIIAHIAYTLGYKRIDLLFKLIYKKDKKR